MQEIDLCGELFGRCCKSKLSCKSHIVHGFNKYASNNYLCFMWYWIQVHQFCDIERKSEYCWRISNFINVNRFIGGHCINQFVYADGIFVWTQSLSGLHELFNKCGNFSKENCITFNSIRYVYIVIKPKISNF